MKNRYKVHRFDISMSRDQADLEQFLNSLEGEVITIIPNVRPRFTAGGMGASVNFLSSLRKLVSDFSSTFMSQRCSGMYIRILICGSGDANAMRGTGEQF